MKKLLVIIDMQEGFRYHESESIIAPLQHVINHRDGDIIFSNFFDTPGSLFETQLERPKFQHTANQQLMKEFDATNHQQCTHHGYTVLTPTLHQHIAQDNYDVVYIGGIYTDVCVSKLAMDLFDANIITKVIENCCASLHGTTFHQYAIETMKHTIGKNNVITL